MKAVVMAGGEGSRLRPLTLGRPKPMVPLVNRPMLEHILLLLKKHGITEVILTVQYMATFIQNQIGDGSDLGMHVTYSVEEHPLGTAGSVRQAAESLDDTFLVISGDALTDFDLGAIVAAHQEKKAIATLTLYRVANPLEYGVVVTDEGGKIREFQEKPSWSEVLTDTINTGIYVLEPEIFKWYPRGQVFDFSKDLFPLLLKEGELLYGHVAEGYWTDVGSLDEYVRASRDVLEGKVEIDWNAEKKDGLWVEPGVDIAPDARLEGPIFLGRDVKVMPGAIIHGPSVVRDNAVIDRRAHIDRSIVWRNTFVGPHSEVRGSILGADCNVQPNAVIFENAVVGDQCAVGRGAIIQPNVKIWPHKEIEAGAVVSTSIIWGSVARRVLFGRYGVSGLINVDFTPESLARLGSAYASTLPVGCAITVNRDLTVPSRMLKRALNSGLAAGGVNVMDLSAVPIPVARLYTCVSSAVGGAHVRVSTSDRTVIHITFFDKNGTDLDKATQRKIETAYFREDFRRAHLDDIGETAYAPAVIERYTEAFMDAVAQDVVRHSGYRLVVDYSFGSAGSVLPGILRALDCHTVDLNAGGELTRTPRSIPEYQVAHEQLAAIVPALKYDLGVLLDVHGERLNIVDSAGRRVPQMEVLAAAACLVFQQHPGATIAVPADAPTVFERLASAHKGKVIRTRIDAQALMATSGQKAVLLAGDGRGRMIFPALQPAFDGMFGLVKLLELLSRAHTRLHEVVADLPAWHMAETDVACPWDKKGRVMRMLSEQYRDRRSRAADGIRIQLGEDWVLALPDPDEPQFHLVAEAKTMEEAQSLVDKYAGVVTGLQQ